MLFINIIAEKFKNKLVHFISRFYISERYLLARHIHYMLILTSPVLEKLKEMELGEGGNLTFIERIPYRIIPILAPIRIFCHSGKSSLVSPVGDQITECW